MSKCEIIGVRIRCPQSNRIVSIARSDFAIGPMDGSRRYHVRCKCGKVHTAPTQRVSKPTGTQRAIPMLTACNGKARSK